MASELQKSIDHSSKEAWLPFPLLNQVVTDQSLDPSCRLYLDQIEGVFVLVDDTKFQLLRALMGLDRQECLSV